MYKISNIISVLREADNALKNGKCLTTDCGEAFRWLSPDWESIGTYSSDFEFLARKLREIASASEKEREELEDALHRAEKRLVNLKRDNRSFRIL